MTFLIIVSVVLSFVLIRAGETIQGEIQTEVAPTFGGDMSIEGSKALPEDVHKKIVALVAREGGVISDKVEMNYTLSTQVGPLLVSLWGVDDAFPLYGEFSGVEEIGEMSTYTQKVSISRVLYDTLAVGGSGVSLNFRGTNYPISSTFTSAPGTALSVFDGGRQVVLPLSFVEELDLLVQGSRVSYQTLMTFPNNTDRFIKNIEEEIETIVGPSYRVRSLNASEGVFQSVGTSLSGYLGLINLLFLLLEVCVLVFLGSRIVHENQLSLQIMRIYGLRDRYIWGYVFLRSLGSIVVGAVLGLMFTYVLSSSLFSLGLVGAVSRGYAAYLPMLGGISLLTLGTLTLPVWLATRAGPLSLLDQSPLPLSRMISWKEGLIGLLIVVVAYRGIVGDIRTVLMHIGVVGGLAAIVSGCIWGLHTLLYRLGSQAGWRTTAFAQRDVLRFLTKPGTQSSMITGGCTVLMILLSWTVMTYAGLQERLQGLTAGGDALFVTNVFDEDREKIDQLSFPIDDIFSVILGRIISINSRSLQEHMSDQGIGGDNQRRFTREFNMTSNPLEDVEITAGSVITKAGDVSVDEDFAKSIGLKLGDKVTISIAGREFDLTVINTRSSVREGVRPFFFFQLFEGQFQNTPKTSFFQIVSPPEKKSAITSEIVTLMGNNVSFIDTGEIIAEVKGYLARVGLLLSVLFGLMIVYALSATFSLFRYAALFQKERFAVYTLLGAGEHLLGQLKSGYIRMYLLISGSIALCSTLAFVFLFRSSQVLDVTTHVIMWGIVTICVVGCIVWLQGRSR